MKRCALFLLLSAAALPLAAQTEEDAPGMGVARLSVMNGDVSVRRGDSGDLIAAAVNGPLVAGDRLLTGPSSRAELQFDWANMIRIGSNAEVRLSELDARRYQIQIAIGTTMVRVLRDSNARVEISTPSVSVRPVGVGAYRVTVLEDGSSEITCRVGEAEVFTPRGTERLRAGSTMLARGSASDPEFREVAAIPLDAWDRWNEERDQMLEGSQAYQHVSPDIEGAEDLDGHGRWVNDDSYGSVWAPAVAPGWAPYQLGRWVWVDYYGWTWVSYDPWGWAPYHYGRWFNSPLYGWCWWPGGMHERHFWRPALVAFFGWGGYGGFRAGIGFGFGNIGWVALAPHEVFHPWYGRGFYGGRGIGNSAIIGNSDIAGMYRNARVANGMSAVSSDVFGRRAIGRSDLIRLNPGQVRNAGLVRGVLPVTPGRESLRMTDRNARAPAFSGAVENRTFFSREGASSTGRVVSFDQQRKAVERVAQRSFGNPSTSMAPAAGRGSATAGQGSAGTGQPSGWRRVGEPSRNAPAAERGASTGSSEVQGQASSHTFGDPRAHTSGPAPNAGRGSSGSTGTSDGGWRRFGDPSSGRGGASPAGPGGQRNSAPPSPNGGGYRQQFNQSGSGNYGGYPPSGAPGWSYGSRSYNSQQPVRISPPIVRQRPPSAPSYGSASRGGSYSAPAAGGGGRSYGGGGSPAYRAPASHAGGGGGSSHGGGGRGRGR